MAHDIERLVDAMIDADADERLVLHIAAGKATEADREQWRAGWRTLCHPDRPLLRVYAQAVVSALIPSP